MKTVMMCGTFDIIHCGHINMFKQAREYGDRLVVNVARDVNAEKVKGMEPFHNEEERKTMLEQISLIDEVRFGDLKDVYKSLHEVKPDVLALGYDQKMYVDNLANKITEYGLKTRIVRLSPYQENRFKSNKIRKYIERLV